MLEKIPAIRATMGTWVYYIGTLTFQEVSDYVKKIDDELHRSKGLSDAIQRSITTNYIQIKKYILQQEEKLFNALVLAVYDGDPEWIEVELRLDDKEYFNVGFLSLSGEEKIFPVDGQHRVEGIKAALNENKELAYEKVPIIFIGHKNTKHGMEKTRRLFSTLNRYAKPVSMSDIVALDEDDSAAILSRYFVENLKLFSGDRVVFSQQKAIPERDKKALTSIITFYQCNVELVKFYYNQKLKNTLKYKKVSFTDFLKFRPSDSVLKQIEAFCIKYWNAFSKGISEIDEYLNLDLKSPASNYRNNKIGGHILFRPIGLLPFVQATMMDAKLYNFENISEISFKRIMRSFSSQNFWLNKFPWKNVAWDPINKTMKTSGNQKLIKLLFLYFANKKDLSFLDDKDLAFIKNKYASFIGFDGNIEHVKLSDLFKDENSS